MTKIIQATIFTLLTLVSTLDGYTVAHAGTVTVFQRESSGENFLNAASGGAGTQRNESDFLGSLTGPFSFSDMGTVSVLASESFSLGSANASGTISITDNVVQSSSSSLLLTATRTATGEANIISGSSIGQYSQEQFFRVRFTVDTDPVQYSLTGSFDPGAITGIIGETGRISLERPFTADVPILITTATAAINETGILMPGLTYEFLVSMTDKVNVTTVSGILSAGDASNLNVVFTLQPIPEPSTALLALVGFATFARWRSRR